MLAILAPLRPGNVPRSQRTKNLQHPTRLDGVETAFAFPSIRCGAIRSLRQPCGGIREIRSQAAKPCLDWWLPFLGSAKDRAMLLGSAQGHADSIRCRNRWGNFPAGIHDWESSKLCPHFDCNVLNRFSIASHRVPGITIYSILVTHNYVIPLCNIYYYIGQRPITGPISYSGNFLLLSVFLPRARAGGTL